ncbi:MAG: aldo/keto reductase [Bacteroidales bacterium]|nr:aldo/keto reductase [Bacteroidales bacterium]MBN2821005.1 aldo/keto reductase [Bacteroidales bacterium]
METSKYIADEKRYDKMVYRKCGQSGIYLPAISLGLWHNFGHVDNYLNGRDIILSAFDKGITHFDLANNYGPPYGSAEENFGRILKNDLMPYRDELIISTKAGYDMWPGPYGNGGSRKYIIASCNQSLKRLGVDYVDIFYSHRFDPETPIVETVLALSQLVSQGKALYVGLSNYNPEQTRVASEMLASIGTPCLIHQPKYSMFVRTPEEGLFDVLEEKGIGSIVFSPLAQGLLTDRYLSGIPEGSRMARPNVFLTKEHLTQGVLDKIRRLNNLAAERGQKLSQMALAWLLRDSHVTSVLVGASSVNQLDDNLQALQISDFTDFELNNIEKILKA